MNRRHAATGNGRRAASASDVRPGAEAKFALGAALVVILVVSLGLWWGIWSAAWSLVSALW